MAGEYLLNYKARKYYNGNGSQLDFLITFPGGNPIETSHVKVFVNGTELTSAWSVVGYGGNNYVRFQTPPNGASLGNVLLKRVTPDTEATRVVDFVGGSLLKAEDLDRSQLNCLYVSQESADLFLDQGGSAVNTTFDQSIAGVKTFTGTVKIADSAEMTFKPTTIPISLIGGVQYVLAAKASDGTVGWEETLLQRLPDNVVLTDGPVAGQEILTPKKFSGSVEFGNAVKITVGAASAKVLTSDGAGNASWATAVNGVRLGSATNPIKTGIVTITAADIGVLGGVEVDGNGVSQVTGPVDFDGSISIGDAGLDNLIINASMKIPTNAGAGKVLTSNTDGFCAWAVPTAYVTSVNGYNGAATGGAVTLSATDVGAVSVSTTQTITGAKTFTGNMVIGATGGANTVEVKATLKYPVSLAATGQAGRIMTSTVDGTAYWAAPPALGVVEINGITGSIVNLIPSNIGAVSSTAAENVAGVKTFTATPVMDAGITVNNTFKYNVGNTASGKFLTSDASGNASWAFVPASGVTSINGDSGTNGAVTITAAQLGAVSTATTQTITGAKTFNANVVLGTTTAQTITVNSPLKYNIGLGVGGNQEGQVLTSTADGTCVWQIPEPAGVSTVNGAPGDITITAAGLGAYTAATIPQASTSTAGIIKIGTGFYQDPITGAVNVQIGGSFPIATVHDAEEPTVGGVLIGDNLTINPTTGRLDAMSGASGTHVTSFLGLTGAVTFGQLTGLAKLSTNTFQQTQYFQMQAFSYDAFRAVKSTSLYPGVAGGAGAEMYATPNHATLNGTVRVQNTTSTNDIWRGYTSAGGITSQITGEGNAKFAGVVEAVGGFKTSGGISIGDNVIDEITLKGTIKIPAGAAADYVLRCTSDTDGTGALIGKAVWSPFTAAPVQSVNNITGAVVITADGTNGLGAVTKDTAQTITGVKTFSANASFNGDVAVGNAYTDLCTVTSNLKLLNNGSTGVGKVWTCSNTDGSGGWVTPTAYITSVNGSTGTAGAVTITAASLGAVTTTGTQTVAGDKTFTGTVNLQGNVVVGTTETTNITISSAIKIATGAVIGKYLTCANTDGSCQWSDAAQAPVQSVNTRVGNVVITADDAVTGIGAVTKSTAQTITGAKTFSAVTSFTEAMTLGDNLADIITISGTLKIAQDAVIGKVLTCGTAGVVAWQPPLITAVITKIGTAITDTQTGEVIIDAARIGAATTAQLATATTAIAAAQTTANNAATAAATAQGTADSKLAAVATTTTANPVGGTLLDCLSGNGTSGSPLKVLGALPIGGISAGDLTGSYPSPTIGAGKVTYNKMQTVAAQRLLGNATSATASVTEIQLASGLTWASGQLDTVNKGDAVLSAANAFTNTTGNSFKGTTTCEALTTTGAVILGDAAADTLTVNATSSFQQNITVAAGKTISTPYLKLTTSPAAGLVLTSDASGNASWAAPTGTTSATANTWTTILYYDQIGVYSGTWKIRYQSGCPFTVAISSPTIDTLSVTTTGAAGQTWSYVMALTCSGGASYGGGYIANGSVSSTAAVALANQTKFGTWSTNFSIIGTVTYSRVS